MSLVPFEKSAIWDLQQDAYASLGPNAWSSYGVPFYLTCCPLIVERTFKAFCAFYNDLFLQGLIDPRHPVYIFDLGAGTARFAYQFMKLLEKKTFPFSVRYVATDISEKTFSFWKNHPYLRPFIRRGLFKMASYQCGQKEAIQCLPDGNTLKVFHNPVCLIANYFFDTVYQSLYQVDNKKLEKGFVDKKSLLEHLQYSFFPVEKADSLIEQYAKKTIEGKFLYPLGAIDTFKSFLSKSLQPLICFHADQAVCSLEQDKRTKHPKIARHGTFSVEVNYFLIDSFAKQEGGESLFEKRVDPSFTCAVTLLKEKSKNFPSLRKEMKKFEKTTLYEYFKKSQVLEETVAAMDQILKESRYDPMIPFAFFDTFCRVLEKANKQEKKSLSKDLKRCLDRFFPICQEESKVYVAYAKLASLCGDFYLRDTFEKEAIFIKKNI